MALSDKRPRLPVRMILAMRQLTSLDQQFLARRTGALRPRERTRDLRPRTAVGHKLDVALVRDLVGDRLHLLPTFRWRLATVPLGLDYDYWADDGAVDLSYHVRELAYCRERGITPRGLSQHR